MNWRSKYQLVDWRDFYPETSEQIPPNVSEPHGMCIQFNSSRMLTTQEIRLHDDRILLHTYSDVVHRLCGIKKGQNMVETLLLVQNSLLRRHLWR